MANSGHKAKEVSTALAALIQATAGALGGVWSMAMLFPLDTLKTLIQAGLTKEYDMIPALLEVKGRFGVTSLYRGIGAKSAETASKNFAYFYAYEILIKALKAKNFKISTTVNLQVGYWAGMMNMLCTMPLEVIATRCQLVSKPALEVAQNILAESGIQGFYNGFAFNAFLCLNPAIVNTLFDIIKLRVVKQRPKGYNFLTPVEAFLLGAFAKCIATIVTYPIVRLKTKLMAGTGDLDAANTKGETKFTYYFRGIGPALLKTCLQTALMYMAKEKIAVVTQFLFISAIHFMRPRTRRHKLKVLGGKPLA